MKIILENDNRIAGMVQDNINTNSNHYNNFKILLLPGISKKEVLQVINSIEPYPVIREIFYASVEGYYHFPEIKGLTVHAWKDKDAWRLIPNLNKRRHEFTNLSYEKIYILSDKNQSNLVRINIIKKSIKNLVTHDSNNQEIITF